MNFLRLHWFDVGLALDWIFGFILGIALNYLGVINIVDWMKDPNTPYVFPARFLVPVKNFD